MNADVLQLIPQIYPAERIVNSNVPVEDMLFLKFACRKWVDTVTGTSSNGEYIKVSPFDVYSGMEDKITHIFVPAPKEIVSTTSVKYTDDTTAVTSLSSFGLGVLEFFSEGFGIGKSVASQTEGRRDIDNTQTLFSNAEKRAYTLNFTLLSLTAKEAQQVARIHNTFHAMALPTLKSSNSSTGGVAAGAGQGFVAGGSIGLLFGGAGVIPGIAIGTAVGAIASAVSVDKGFSPALWRFGIGVGTTGKIDPSWLGQTQICVLKNVSVNTAAGGNPYAIESSYDEGERLPRPLLTSFSLTFVELDPVYRIEDSIEIISKNSI